jgi:hypothetical protein
MPEWRLRWSPLRQIFSSAAAAAPGPRTSSAWESPEESEIRSVSEGETGGYVDFLANASGSYIP